MPAELKTLVDQMPDPDNRQMFTANIDKDKIEQAIAGIQEGGAAHVRGLINMLGEPGSAQDVKPHYALHCLGNHLLQTKVEPARRQFAEVLAQELSGAHSNYIKGFLCQELQWAGRREATPALGRLLLNEDLVERAALALVGIRDGAAEQFRAALPQAKGKCRLNIVQGLGAVADPESAPALREALRDPDRETRIAAGWALARLGDSPSSDALLKAADNATGWERIQATKHCLLLAEQLLAANQKPEAARVYRHLRDSRTDPAEAYIRQAAARGLEQAT